MPVSDHRQLQCWQLGDSLRAKVIALCEHRRVANDFRFCDGFRDAAGSVCRNLAEGFARYESPHIVQFFRYALASLAETEDYLSECRARGVIDDTTLDQLIDLCGHTRATTLKFMKPHLQKAARSRQSSRRGRGA